MKWHHTIIDLPTAPEHDHRRVAGESSLRVIQSCSDENKMDCDTAEYKQECCHVISNNVNSMLIRAGEIQGQIALEVDPSSRDQHLRFFFLVRPDTRDTLHRQRCVPEKFKPSRTHTRINARQTHQQQKTPTRIPKTITRSKKFFSPCNSGQQITSLFRPGIVS